MCTLSYETPAASATSFATLRYFSALALQSFWYCSGVSVTMPGSSEKVWKVGEMLIAVTLAPIDFANSTPRMIAFSERAEPSVGINKCLYMTVLPVVTVRATAIYHVHRQVNQQREPSTSMCDVTHELTCMGNAM